MFARALLVAAVTVGALATPARAQVAKSQVVSINPIWLPAGFFSGEYELALGPNVSGAVGGSYFSLADVEYVAGDVKLRYYPRRTLEGFSVGASAGLIHFDDDVDVRPDRDDGEDGVTLGTSIDYSWLLGANKAFAVGLGLGFKRVLVFGGETPDVTTFYPTVRASIGVAF